MVADEQTQRLPFERRRSRASPNSAATPARRFRRRPHASSHPGRKHYARLFEDAPELSVASGDLVFTGVTDDPRRSPPCGRSAFSVRKPRPRPFAAGIRPARRGPQRPRARGADGADAGAARSLRRIGDADAALSAFDEALARMPAAVELLSILRSNGLYANCSATCSAALPAGAGDRGRPRVLDAAIDPARAVDLD